MSTAHTTYYHSPAMRGIVSTDIHVDPLYNPTASPANGCLCREEFQHKPALDRPFSRPRMAGKPGQPALIPCSHVAVSAARSRRDHCLIWTRFATPAAGRRRVVHLHAPVLHQLDKLHKKVQKPVDVVQTWSVQITDELNNVRKESDGNGVCHPCKKQKCYVLRPR